MATTSSKLECVMESERFINEEVSRIIALMCVNEHALSVKKKVPVFQNLPAR